MFQYTILIQALGLALLQENTMEAMIKEAKSSSRITTSLLPCTQEIGRGTLGQIPQIKKISQAEMQDRKEKKLCYYCDKKYEPRHKCERRQIYLLEGKEDGEIIGQNDEPIGQEDEPLVSVHAIVGATSHQTMQIRGNIKKKVNIILIDFRSTHNFLDVTVVKHTGCVIQQNKPLMVVMADGTKIASMATCKQLVWSMQDKEFKSNMRLIPLGGCDMVLGIQWLAQLRPILWDFKN